MWLYQIQLETLSLRHLEFRGRTFYAAFEEKALLKCSKISGEKITQDGQQREMKPLTSID